MSSFCGISSIPAYTQNQLTEIWPKTDKAILPSTMPTLTNGLASQTFLTQYVTGLASGGKLPTPPQASAVTESTFDAPEGSDPLATFVLKENEFLDNIKQEYCHYESRYFSALDAFLSNVGNASLSTTTPATVDTKLAIVRDLNGKLTVLTQIVNEISKYRYNTSQQYQNDINSLNNQFKERGRKLAAQTDILNKESAAADLHKKMMDYTVEKNKAHQNLLSLFAVLNITAIAMLFYVSRS